MQKNEKGGDDLEPFLIFAVALIIAMILIFYHSFITYGSKMTFLYFGFAFVYGTLREKVRLSSHYTFNMQGITIIGVPIFAIVGWLFSFYIAMFLAFKAMKRDFIKRKTNDFRKVLNVSILSMVIGGSIDWAVEGAALHLGLWYMNTQDLTFGYFPVIIGYSFTAFLFCYSFLVLINPYFYKTKYLLPLFCLYLTDFLFDNLGEIWSEISVIIVVSIFIIAYYKVDKRFGFLFQIYLFSSLYYIWNYLKTLEDPLLLEVTNFLLALFIFAFYYYWAQKIIHESKNNLIEYRKE